MTSVEDFRSAVFGFNNLIEEFEDREYISLYKNSVIIINKALINFFSSFAERRPYPALLDSFYGIINDLHNQLEYILRSEAPLCMYAIVEDMLERYKACPAYMILKAEGYAMIPYTYWLNSALRGIAGKLDELCDKFVENIAQIYFIYSSSRALDYPIRWPALFHEISHVIDFYKEFSDRHYPEEMVAPEHKENFECAKNYYRESFADLLATHYFGPYYGEALYALLHPVLWDESDPHPPHNERIKLIAEELNFLGFNEESRRLSEKGETLKTRNVPAWM